MPTRRSAPELSTAYPPMIDPPSANPTTPASTTQATAAAASASGTVAHRTEQTADEDEHLDPDEGRRSWLPLFGPPVLIIAAGMAIAAALMFSPDTPEQSAAISDPAPDSTVTTPQCFRGTSELAVGWSLMVAARPAGARFTGSPGDVC